MASSDPAEPLLERHQCRRFQSIPTLTVLCGPVNLGVHVWRTWNRWRAVPVVSCGLEPGEPAAAWAAVLAAHHDLGEAALAWLARRTGRTTEDWRGRLAAMTPHDLERFWQAVGLTGDNPTAVVCRRIIGLRTRGENLSPSDLVARLRAEIGIPDEGGVRFLAALASLVPADRLPALLFSSPPAGDRVGWLAQAARLVGPLVEAVPSLPAALAVPAEAAETFVRQGPPSHYQALVREGQVTVQGLDAAHLAERLAAEGVDPGGFAGPVGKLAADGADEEVMALFAEAARCVGKQATLEEEDRARSAAERFLFERLESLAETAGLFALNQRLEFRHGRAAAEVDLLAADLKLVIELDGSYYHLNDQDAYRRDRRKDWLLQRHGYLVLRFLADDVVRRLEEILETILAAVAFRRGPFHPEQRTEA